MLVGSILILNCSWFALHHLILIEERTMRDMASFRGVLKRLLRFLLNDVVLVVSVTH